jgi:hypothetical protein
VVARPFGEAALRRWAADGSIIVAPDPRAIIAIELEAVGDVPGRLLALRDVTAPPH